MHEELVTLWGKSKSVSANDIGRLARRIDVFIQPIDCKSDGSSQPCNPKSDSRSRDLVNVIEVLSARLESDEVNSKLPSAIDLFLQETIDKVDYRLYVKQLLSIFDNDTSPVMKVLRLVNQATLFIACVYLRQGVNKVKTKLKSDELLVKDSGGDDGWRVEIKIADECITVTHLRKDQCLGAPTAVDYWDIQWKLEVKFEIDLSAIISSELRITDIWCKNSKSSENRTTTCIF